MRMTATVIRVEPRRGLLVRNQANGQEVFVNFANTGAFRAGDVVRINYTGTMTFSIPPQITATSVTRVPQATPRPPQTSQTEIRGGTVLRAGRNFLYVRNPANNQQVRVNYAYARHFCVGQRVNVAYDSIFLNNLLEVNATDVTPVC